MFRVPLCIGAAVAAALLSMTPAKAASVAGFAFDGYDRSQLGNAQHAMSDFLDSRKLTNLHTETFEDQKAWNGTSGTANPHDTNVGSFSAFGGAGSGQSRIGNGAALQVRGDNDMRWGRYNNDASRALGGQWLDSNDNRGMRWEIGGVGAFDTIAFFVTDVADVGGKFSIRIGDTLYSDLAMGAKLASGNIHLVQIMLSEAVTNLTVELMHDRTNDGFGIDGAAVARIAPAPLPPAAALLATGLVALAGLRRRRSPATG